MMRSPTRPKSVAWKTLLPIFFSISLVIASVAEVSAFYVSGTVRTTNGLPAAGVDIDAVETTTGVLYTLPGATTDANGRYDVLLNPGHYDLTFTPAPGQKLVGKVQTGVSTYTNQKIDVTLQVGEFIFGTISGPGDPGVLNVDIDVFDSSTGTKLFTAFDLSDSDGFYSVVVPPGTYDVVYEPRPSSGFLVAESFNVSAGVTAVLLNRTLASGLRVSGRVVDPEGDGMPNVDLDVTVSATGASVKIANEATDASGDYEFVVPAGTYDVSFEADAGLGFDTNDETNNVILANTVLDEVEMSYPFTLSGFVRDESLNPVAGVALRVSSAANGSLPLSGNTTDLSGFYSVEVPAGTHKVTFRSPEGNGLASNLIENVVVAGNRSLNATLPPGIRLYGQVRSSTGAGIPNVDFDVELPTTGEDYPVWNDDTDALGNYSFWVPAGSFDLDIDPGAGQPYVALLVGGIVMVTELNLNLTLQDGVFLSGKVTDGLNAWSEVDIDVRIPNTTVEVATSNDNSDVNGDYFVTVPPGLYDVLFTPAAGSPITSLLVEDVDITSNTMLNATLSSITTSAPPVTPISLPTITAVPNPSRGDIRFDFFVPRAGVTELAIFDVAGRRVSVLSRGHVEEGNQSFDWNGRDERGRPVSPGVYFVRMTGASSNSASGKFIRTR